MANKWNRVFIEDFMSFYLDDSRLVLPGEVVWKGREVMRVHHKSRGLDKGSISIVTIDRATISSSNAVVDCEWTVSLPEKQEPQTEKVQLTMERHGERLWYIQQHRVMP